MYKENVILTIQISHRGLFFITQSNRVFGLAHQNIKAAMRGGGGGGVGGWGIN